MNFCDDPHPGGPQELPVTSQSQSDILILQTPQTPHQPSTACVARALAQRLVDAGQMANGAYEPSLWALQHGLCRDDDAGLEMAREVLAQQDPRGLKMGRWPKADHWALLMRARLMLLDRWFVALQGIPPDQAQRSFEALYPDLQALSGDVDGGAWDACDHAARAMASLGPVIVACVSWGREMSALLVRWLCRVLPEGAHAWGTVNREQVRAPLDGLEWSEAQPLLALAVANGGLTHREMGSLLQNTRYHGRWRRPTQRPAATDEGSLTQAEAAQLLGVTDRTLRNRMKSGAIPRSVILVKGQTKFVRKGPFLAWMSEQGLSPGGRRQ